MVRTAIGATILWLAAGIAAASASSILEYRPSGPIETPSIITVPMANSDPLAAGQPVSDEKVSAINETPKSRRNRSGAMPMVIRGGVDGPSSPVAAAPVAAEAVMDTGDDAAEQTQTPPPASTRIK